MPIPQKQASCRNIMGHNQKGWNESRIVSVKGEHY